MQVMGEYARDQVKRKVSQFILSEAGRVGYRNAFSMAALVTASSLAAMMLSAHSAKADWVQCGDQLCNNQFWTYCCKIQQPDGSWYFTCANEDPPPGADGQPSECWLI